MDISVVVPTYKSSGFIGELVTRLEATLAAISGSYEIILIDDCSPDETWSALTALRETRPGTLRIIRLMKNAGQHNAILCGFGYANGDIVVTMDDDLQHPPEEVPKLVAAVRNGQDIAIGAYDEKRHAGYRNVAGSMVDGVIRGLYNLPRDFQLTSFRAVRGPLARAARDSNSPYPYVTCILFDQASRVTNVPVSHMPRHVGESSYSLVRSALLAINLVFSYSSLPLYGAIILCGLMFLLSVSVFGWIVISTLMFGVTVPGWASTIAVMTFFSSVILGSLAVIGVYVGRTHQQLTGRRRPFLVDEAVL